MNEISLTVGTGQIVVFIGPSSCGKSACFVSSAVSRANSKSSRIHPDPVHGTQLFSYVFQDHTLLPWRTVAGNVRLVIENLRMEKAERRRRVADALARVGLSEFADSYPKALSGGMLQRVSIARALVIQPDTLLMDGPLASLDEQVRTNLLSDLCRLWNTNPYTCLYVTHSPSEAVRLGHRIVLLSDRPGHIREIIPIDMPLDNRSESHPTIAGARGRVWSSSASSNSGTCCGGLLYDRSDGCSTDTAGAIQRRWLQAEFTSMDRRGDIRIAASSLAFPSRYAK